MRQVVRLLMLLVALSACTPNPSTDAERRAEAARADSSAAGYDVGPATSSRTVASLDPGTVTPPPDSARRSGPTVIVPPTGTSTPPRDTTAPRPVLDSSRTSTGRGGRGSDPGTGTGGTTDSGARQLPPLDPAVEATFLVFDTTKKTATFQLAAGAEIPSQVSFNGIRRGGRTLMVPLGWRVTIAFANRDPELPHSAIIIAAAGAIPEQLPEPAFPRAQTVRVDEGLLEGDSDEIILVADRAGRYILGCGVLGHAQRGQWIALEVSTTALIPRYR